MGDISTKAMRTDTGWKDGEAFEIDLVEVRPGVWVSSASASDWDDAFTEGENQGIYPAFDSSFRPMQEQIDLWTERMDPAYPGVPKPYMRGTPNAVGKVKGVAAFPGWSEHQRGEAIDLGFGGDDAAREAFAAIAADHGIVRNVASEHWHFAWHGIPKLPPFPTWALLIMLVVGVSIIGFTATLLLS